MPVVSSRGIFLSYRRADAPAYARLLQHALRDRIPDAHVFMDMDAIEAGVDFVRVIREAINSCAVLVAVIGRQWATLTDEQGRRRIDDPDDYVRFEVRAALERGVRVIPVLVDGARPLQREHLPSELYELAALNALEVSHSHYDFDVDRLLNSIRRVIGEASMIRAKRVLTDAEGIAQAVADKYSKAGAPSRIARALSAIDPDRAERIGRSITNEISQVAVLTEIANASSRVAAHHSAD